MLLWEKLLGNEEYIKIAEKIGAMHFITDGKWDWEHGLGHYKRVSSYVENILKQLHASSRTIELGCTAALLHDMGLIKGDKIDHALYSSQIFMNYIEDDITKEEEEMLRGAIRDHSRGENIQSLIGLALVLADKLDVTYHRVEHSTIHDTINNEIQKIKKVDIGITEKDLVVTYTTDSSFDANILKNWDKAVTIPRKIASYLDKNYIFMINEEKIDDTIF